MRRVTLCVVCALALRAGLMAQIPDVMIRQVQQVPFDSLVLADALQNTVPARWTLQRSPAPYYNDTVTVTAVCVVPSKVLTFTAGGFTMLLYDTATVENWGAIFVRCNAPADTAQNILDGFLNVERGDLITITGIVADFPLTSMNSVTQFQPVAGRPITILGTAPVPPYRRMEVGDFYRGSFPGGTVKYSSGEPFESMLVEFVNLTVDARVNAPRGTFSAIDESGNQIAMYDASRYFTLGHGSTTPFPADTQWTRVYPTVGTRIDTLRGYITTVSGSENPRGYRIAPIFRGDVAIGIILPAISTHRRNPIIVTPDSAARISVRVQRQNGGFPINGVFLRYSVDNGPFVDSVMAYNPVDSTYGATIPSRPADTFVHYFIQAQDSAGNFATMASSAFGGAASDTSKGFFFYTVLDRPLTIRDVQYTPYTNGRSPYPGSFVTVSGLVTGDTVHIGANPLNTGGTNAWYMQSGAAAWEGLWFVGSDLALFDLRNGDSVTVSGFLGEQFDVTRLSGVTSPIIVHTTGNPEPAPVSASTGTFGPNVGNGTPAAEQYEGMLVRFTDVRVSSIDPVFSDATEFEVDDGSGPVIVRRDGTHHFSNIPADTGTGKTILRLGDRISSLTGIMYYSFNRYKMVPRTDADFGTVTGVAPDHAAGTPVAFVLDQNYPNPFNPSTTIGYALPSDAFVTLRLYNILGQQVATLVQASQAAGRYTVRLDAHALPTGVYFYRLQTRDAARNRAGETTLTRKLMLLR